ncbi:uncharacterized protein L969DRAFT_89024 [Mixia osmundae IAM 14324]|uniref:DUF202 domain-containing protein n=1 Tax=Mixia osmundae (strain CBS 9802 / IAM 14324 / JCM 22182 / KY 12970) TaxID=764103 RepID=G7E812_MIXOS|nr:uncharacterized protein L969DRAFT_89024 [Mixia osmundae IAM 14324]KEI38571.1 hypothetical protein L969DRAFT_89024 [Mixia osmundae IAM 14324]GAA98972.1 hypothetical protein E5Q_05660 [Mixia osmundae IAM 14324]
MAQADPKGKQRTISPTIEETLLGNESETSSGVESDDSGDNRRQKSRRKGSHRGKERPQYLYQGHRRSSFLTDDISELTELRARQRTFDGAYFRTALGSISYALVILKIFDNSFITIGLIYVIVAGLIFLLSILRRRRSNHDFADVHRLEVAAELEAAARKAQTRLKRDVQPPESARLLHPTSSSPRMISFAMPPSFERDALARSWTAPGSPQNYGSLSTSRRARSFKSKLSSSLNQFIDDSFVTQSQREAALRTEAEDARLSAPPARPRSAWPDLLAQPGEETFLMDSPELQQSQSIPEGRTGSPKLSNTSKIPVVRRRFGSLTSLASLGRRSLMGRSDSPTRQSQPQESQLPRIFGRNFRTSGDIVVLLIVCLIGLELALFILILKI